MADRTNWTHIRPSNLRDDVRKGLEARIADPLWTLARQWQMGEFDGDDAASPIKIKLRHGVVSVNGLASPKTPSAIHQMAADDLIEPLVEADEAEQGPARLRMSGEAGLQLLRMLPQVHRGRARMSLQRAFPLDLPQTEDVDSARILTALKNGSFDGLAVRDRIAKNPGSFAGLAGLPSSGATEIATAWLAYVEDRFADQIGAGFWHQDRLEHHANLHARRGANIDIKLHTDDHMGGRLDWHAFDVASAKGVDAAIPAQKTEWLLPTPISYSGMPAERFWDFEDGQVFFGGLTLEDTDLAQVILTEFATVYSNDWFLVPVPVETGSLSRITLMEIYDTFGEKTVVKSCAQEDGEGSPWRFFELSGDLSAKKDRAPWLYIPRASSSGDHSRPVEQVRFVRDEMANLAWGIERVVETPAGGPLDRAQHWKRNSDAFPDYRRDGASPVPAGNAEDEQPWRYRYLTTSPPHWVPFAPEVDNANLTTGRLVRSRMGEWDLLGAERDRFAGAQGRIMDPSAPMVVEEEELVRGGVDVSRQYESARSPDGRLLIWSSRQKRPASREPSSGRETDVIRTGRRI